MSSPWQRCPAVFDYAGRGLVYICSFDVILSSIWGKDFGQAVGKESGECVGGEERSRREPSWNWNIESGGTKKVITSFNYKTFRIPEKYLLVRNPEVSLPDIASP